jgi:GNAT superfamily N-acetyltransferase
VESFNPLVVGERRLAELVAVQNAVVAERFPGDAPRPVGYYRGFYAEQASSEEFGFAYLWALMDDVVVGQAVSMVRLTMDNAHAAHVSVVVAPGARRRGVGRRLFAEAVASVRREGRRLVTGTVIGPEPSSELPGSHFARALGASVGSVERHYRLLLGDADSGLLESWREEGARRSPEMELVWRPEPYGEDELSEVAGLMQVTVASAPRDELEEEDWVITPESVREFDRRSFSLGFRRVALLARERASGRLAAYTEMERDPNNHHVLLQRDTGVDPAWQGRGLARWLKAEMLLWALRERPERMEVRSANADSNAAILSVNERLGFSPWVTEATWQLSVKG